MSDLPKHITAFSNGVRRHEQGDHNRYTLTSGPEWDALMERVEQLDYPAAMTLSQAQGMAIRDLLAYFGEQNDGR